MKFRADNGQNQALPHDGVARRSKWPKAAVTVSAALAAFAFAAPPATATSAAAAPPATARALAHCPNGFMVAVGDSNVYSGWDRFQIIGHVSKGDLVRCAPATTSVAGTTRAACSAGTAGSG